MTGVPFSKFAPITSSVVGTGFRDEKKHILLAITNTLMPTSQPFLEFGGASAITDIKRYFGSNMKELPALQKYFGFLAKSGNAPEKVIIGRWYKTSAPAFIKGAKADSLANIVAKGSGDITLTLNGVTAGVTIDPTGAASYSDLATVIQTAVVAASTDAGFTGATVSFSTVTNGFVIISGVNGAQPDANIAPGTTNDLTVVLGLAGGSVSQGANAETFRDFCDRSWNANTAGYSITTLEALTIDDIQPAVDWIQGSVGGQTLFSDNRLVFNFPDKDQAISVSQALSLLDYTGYVITYDPYNENINVLDCAIAASIDYNASNGAINFNFQPCPGYTPITNKDSVVDYQEGITNLSLTAELDSNYISYVYSVGFGSQITNLYGMGLMAGVFGTEDVQVNESWLEKDIQTAVMNGFIAVNKLKLQGKDARYALSTWIDPSFKRGQINGTIAYNGILTDTNRISIAQATGNPDAAQCVADNGYYFKIEDLTPDDIALRRVRVLACYLCGGVVNKVQIINKIYQ